MENNMNKTQKIISELTDTVKLKGIAIITFSVIGLITVYPSLAQSVDGVEIDSNTTESQGRPLPLEQIKTFVDIFTRIKQHYVEPVSDETLLEYAVDGMLNGLDPHSVYLKDEEYEELNEGATGSFAGLGMEVVMDDGFLKVIAPIDDTPAAAAGMPTAQAIKLIPAKAFISALNSAKLSEVSTAATPKIKTGIRNGAVIMMARKPLRGRPAMIAAGMAL